MQLELENYTFLTLGVQSRNPMIAGFPRERF